MRSPSDFPRRPQRDAGAGAIVGLGCLVMLAHLAWISLLAWAIIKLVLWVTSGDAGG